MKKTFFLFVASLFLFASCNQHIQNNNFTITINYDTSSSLNRIADPNNKNQSAFYGILKDEDGNIIEETTYDITYIDEDYPTCFGTLNFSRLRFDAKYNLTVLYVDNGTTKAKGELNNIYISREEPTHRSLTLETRNDNPEKVNINAILTNNTENGDYKVTLETFGYNPKIPLGNISNNALINFNASLEDSIYTEEDFNLYEIKTYIISEGKDYPASYYVEKDNSNVDICYRIHFSYNFTKPGKYKAALRLINKESGLFSTSYATIYIDSDIYETNYVMYTQLRNNDTNELWISSNFSEDLLNTKPVFSTQNLYDYCFDTKGNIYITDGTAIYVNKKGSNTCSKIIDLPGEVFKSVSNHNSSKIIIKYDSFTNKLWIAGDYAGIYQRYNISYVDLNKDTYILKNISFDDYEETNSRGFNFQDSQYGSYTLNSFAVYADTIYFITTRSITTEDHAPHAEIRLFTYYNDGGDYLYSYNIENKQRLLLYPGTEYGSQISPDISDAIFYKGKLIILVSATNKDLDSFFNAGFMLVYNPTNDSVSLKGNDNLHLTNDTMINSLYNIPKSAINNTFIAPQKIIALTPKKLVISDDGAVFTRTPSEYKYKNINRYHIVDLETLSITSTTTLEKLKWNKEEIDFGNQGCYLQTKDED